LHLRRSVRVIVSPALCLARKDIGSPIEALTLFLKDGGQGFRQCGLFAYPPGRLTLQRYLMGHLMQASFPVREIGTVMTLLHARYKLEDLIRLEHFQG